MLTDLRTEIVSAIQTEKPIFYGRPTPQGDNLIQRWGYKHVLEKLCQEAGIEDKEFTLKSYPQGSNFKKQRIDLGQYRHIDHNFNDLSQLGVLGSQLQSIGHVLDVPITTDDLSRVPQPEFADFYPWINFKKEDAISSGLRLRDKILSSSSSIAVIAQFGSQSEKRFSDIQIAELAKEVKEKNPSTYIVVLSDKELLSGSLPKPWHRFTKPPSYYGFPYSSPDFRTELRNRSFGDCVDNAIFGKDINQFCTWFYTADLLIATDSFGSWLGCGMRSLREDRGGFLEPKDALILYTIANPDLWKIPGILPIASKGIDTQRSLVGSNFDFLSYQQYYINHSWGRYIQSDNPKRGILPEDIDSIKDQLALL